MSDPLDFLWENDKPTAPCFDFRLQMALGDRGEKDFITYYSKLEPKKALDRAYDFDTLMGKVELKTDDYSMSETRNFFMETVSDIASGKVGGPIRAFNDDVPYFVYYFIQDKTFFWFETPKLHNKLQELIASSRFKIKQIKNRTWTTEGFAIPRNELECVLFRRDVFH